nr:MAG TPA: hypothetical protein [Caudoviricetes sp.]
MEYCKLNTVERLGEIFECVKRDGVINGNIFVYRMSPFIHLVFDVRTGLSLGSVVTQVPIELDELEIKLAFGFIELTRTKPSKKDIQLKKYIDYRLEYIKENKFIQFSKDELGKFIEKTIRKGE